MDWAILRGFAWPEDKEHCEENGRMLAADSRKVSARAKRRGITQLGTLGGGNHYCEVQVIDEVRNLDHGERCGLSRVGQVCIMLHSGSRGLGHQVATDALEDIESNATEEAIDRQLGYTNIHNDQGRNYMSAMAAAANFAWVNRACLTYLIRKAFSKVFGRSPEELDMHVVYDVSHNIAKREDHFFESSLKSLLVHRKGATRAFPPHHPLVPLDYQFNGQPVLVGGSMGTCSYVLSGTSTGMSESFGSTCHGAGRALSRRKSRLLLDYREVLQCLCNKGIVIRVASANLIAEEAPEAYKDVIQVISTCELAGISQRTVKVRPVAVIKG